MAVAVEALVLTEHIKESIRLLSLRTKKSATRVIGRSGFFFMVALILTDQPYDELSAKRISQSHDALGRTDTSAILETARSSW